MSKIEPNDEFLVQRSSTSFKTKASDLMSTIEDTDLMLIQRGINSFKVTCEDVKDQLGGGGVTGSIDTPVAVLTPLTGAGINEGQPYKPLSTAITAVGVGGSAEYKTDTIASVKNFTNTGIIATVSGWNNPGNAINTSDPTNTRATGVNNTAGKITFSTPLLGVTKVEAYTRFNNNGRAGLKKADGNDIQVDMTGTGTKWYTVYDGASIDLKEYYQQVDLSGNKSSDDFWALRVNDVVVGNASQDFNNPVGSVNPIASPDIVLTFPADNNFDKFEVGDVVQGPVNSPGWNGEMLGPSAKWPGPTGAFDGNPSSGTGLSGAVPSGSVLVWNGNIEFSSSCLIYWYVETTNDSEQWVTGSSGRTNVTSLITKITGKADLNTITPIDVTSLGSPITKFECNAKSDTGAGIARIVVDGVDLLDGMSTITAIDAAGPTITTDGGEWLGADGSGVAGDGRYEPAQEWSSKVVAGSQFDGGTQSASKPFDGSLSTRTQTTNVSGAYFGYTFSGLGVNPVRVYIKTNSGSCEVNGSTIAVADATWVDCGNIELSTIKVLANTSSPYNSPSLYAVEVAGKLLVDSSVPGGQGATDVTKTVTSDASLTFTSPLELANMVGPLSQVDENGNVKTPVTSTIASVGVTDAWNQSQEWSANVSGGSFGPWSGAFDGDLTTVGGNPSLNDTTSCFWTAIPATTIEIYAMRGPGGSIPIILNPDNGSGGFDISSLVTSSTPQWWNVSSLFTDSTFEKITCDRLGVNDGTVFINIYGLRVNGKILVNTGIAGDPGLPLLTFNAPNPDLQYFKPGDQVGTVSSFAPVLYDGKGGTQSIKTGFSPSLVWMKSRKNDQDHYLFDQVRGTASLKSNTTGAENPGDWISYQSDGFTMKNGQATSGYEYVAWCWGAGDTTEINNEGTIKNVEVRSNGNFSVVSFTGTKPANGSYGHGLNSAPAMIISKSTATSEWAVYHKSLAQGTQLRLQDDGVITSYVDAWVSAPTSSVVNVGSWNAVNGPEQMIAYCWAETPRVSSFGSFTHTGSAGSVTGLGFKPSFVLVKDTDVGEDWRIFDSARGSNLALMPNLIAAETAGWSVTFDDDGFSWISGSFASGNYIYAAFAASNPIEVIDVDVAKNQMTVDGGDWAGSDGSGDASGETEVTGPALVASANDVEYLDGNTLGVNGVSGSWRVGLNAQGTEVTASAPSPDSIQYTSANGDPLTTQFTGTNATLTTRTWTWQVSNAATGPWTDFTTRVDTPGQDGATELVNRPTLEEKKFYQVKVRYDSSNAAFVESTFNTFKTGVNS